MILNYGSVCSGIGCFDRGLEAAGWNCRWQVEIEAERQRVLAKHWPDVKRHENLSTLTGESLERVTLFVGGTPCQDLSVAGRRGGLAGKRSGLFFHFVRLADEIAPLWILWENVSGALSSNNGRDFAIVLGSFTGYTPEVPEGGWRNSGGCSGPKRSCAWRVLDSQFVGGCALHGDWRGRGPVPQSRRRLFIIAVAGDGAELAGPESRFDAGRLAGLPVEVLFEPESCSRDFKKGKKKRQNIVGTLGGGATRRGWNDDLDRSGAFIPEAFQANGSGSFRPGAVTLAASDDNGSNHVITHALTSEGADASEDGTGRGTPIVACQERGREGGPVCEHQDDIAYALTSPANVRRSQERNIAAGLVVRRLTPTECARLMGLPDDWLDLDPPLSNSAKYRFIGDGGVTFVLEWLGNRIRQVHELLWATEGGGHDAA